MRGYCGCGCECGFGGLGRCCSCCCCCCCRARSSRVDVAAYAGGGVGMRVRGTAAAAESGRDCGRFGLVRERVRMTTWLFWEKVCVSVLVVVEVLDRLWRIGRGSVLPSASETAVIELNERRFVHLRPCRSLLVRDAPVCAPSSAGRRGRGEGPSFPTSNSSTLRNCPTSLWSRVLRIR